EGVGVDLVLLADQEETGIDDHDAAAGPDGALLEGQVEARLLDGEGEGHLDLFRDGGGEADAGDLADDVAVFAGDVAERAAGFREWIDLSAAGTRPGPLGHVRSLRVFFRSAP